MSFNYRKCLTLNFFSPQRTTEFRGPRGDSSVALYFCALWFSVGYFSNKDVFQLIDALLALINYHIMKKIFFVGVLFFSVFSNAQKKSNPSNFAKTITSEDLKRHLYIIAGREMEGRETATKTQKALHILKTNSNNWDCFPEIKVLTRCI